MRISTCTRECNTYIIILCTGCTIGYVFEVLRSEYCPNEHEVLASAGRSEREQTPYSGKTAL
ncbi:hypothetical protein V1523DRAFT_410332 [Lipomyces doorenjongii]